MTKYDDLLNVYNKYCDLNLSIDMTRGKPCSEQLDLTLPMLNMVTTDDFKTEDNVDSRNYGGLDGLPEAKRLFSSFLEVGENEIIIGGNSSLNIMHDTIVHCLLQGVAGHKPWSQQSAKFICPSPGYDRHFNLCQHHNIELINVECKEDGPDMDAVENLVSTDASVKGIWVVPKYSNPTGSTCSDEVVDRLARMKTAAPDFRIFWDNAYTVHHLVPEEQPLKNILAACKKAGNPDRVFLYGSTSKITFAGSGLAMMGGSVANMTWMRSHMKFQTIGPDKLNQLRHVRFFQNLENIHAHMKKHAEILRPKFDAVLQILSGELEGKNLATWTKPRGGYFISLNTQPKMAKRVVELAAKAGVKLTGAGAAFPYSNDPLDRNIRIAPTLPRLNDLKQATEVLAVCIQLAAVEAKITV